jgi:hypothetical membrane protein
MNYKDVAGALLLIAGIVAIMGIITAEATYPGYSTAKNHISDLGATRPPNSIIKQPAATIFSATLVVVGLLMKVVLFAPIALMDKAGRRGFSHSFLGSLASAR